MAFAALQPKMGRSQHSKKLNGSIITKYKKPYHKPTGKMGIKMTDVRRKLREEAAKAKATRKSVKKGKGWTMGGKKTTHSDPFMQVEARRMITRRGFARNPHGGFLCPQPITHGEDGGVIVRDETYAASERKKFPVEPHRVGNKIPHTTIDDAKKVYTVSLRGRTRNIGGGFMPDPLADPDTNHTKPRKLREKATGPARSLEEIKEVSHNSFRRAPHGGYYHGVGIYD